MEFGTFLMGILFLLILSVASLLFSVYNQVQVLVTAVQTQDMPERVNVPIQCTKSKPFKPMPAYSKANNMPRLLKNNAYPGCMPKYRRNNNYTGYYAGMPQRRTNFPL